MMDSADLGDGLNLPPIPRMYQADLAESHQQLAIALAYLMEDRGITHFVVPSERVIELSMARVELEVDESERMAVRMESQDMGS